MAEYVWIYDSSLNMSYTMHSTRSLYKLISTYWEERFGKIITAFNYFCKTLHLKSLRDSECSMVLNMPGFWIFRVTQGLTIFENMTGFWVCVEMQLWHGSEYSRILNMPAFCICRCYTSETYSDSCQIFKMTRFAKGLMRECRRATRNFSGQGKFRGTKVHRKTFRHKQEKKAPAVKHFQGVFSPRYS